MDGLAPFTYLLVGMKAKNIPEINKIVSMHNRTPKITLQMRQKMIQMIP